MTDSHYSPARFVTPRRLARRLASTSTVRAAVATVGISGILAASTFMIEGYGSASPQPDKVAAASVAPGTTVAPSATGDGAEADQTAAAPAEPSTGPGYRLVAADGGVFSHGWFEHEGSATGLAASPIVGMAQTRDGEGYWLTSVDGGVFAFGSAPFFGSAVGVATSDAVDITAHRGDDGYWVVTKDGGVYSFGAAPFFGAIAGTTLNAPVVSIAATPTGNGYWIATADGGVFAFGDAPYLGGGVGLSLHAPVTSVVPTSTGNGYWLVARDGGVFAFGDALFFGSLVGQQLNRPIVDMEVETSGRGYWLVSSDGGVFAFGDAPFLGSAATQRLNAPVIGIEGGTGRFAPPPAPAPAAAVATPAPALATPAPGPVLLVPQAAAAAQAPALAPQVSDAAAAARLIAGPPIDGRTGWDISYPQCGGQVPAAPFDFGIVGVNGGRMFKRNPCLAEQWRWATASPAAGIYLNINFPRSPFELSMGAGSVRQPACNGSISCIAYNFGWNGVGDALTYARSQGVDAPFAWLDVEQLNYWTPSPELNAVVLRGAIDAVRDAGLGVGIYSTPYQYNKIMGAENPGVPVWTAGAPGLEAASRWCVERSFGGGPVAITQMLPGQFDFNLACPGAGPAARYFTVR